MRSAAIILALPIFALLTACAPRTANPIHAASVDGPKDDYELIVRRFGHPDAEDSTDRDVPRPPIPSKWITYKKEHVRFVFIPTGGLGDPPPYLWKLLGPTDPRTRDPLKPAVAVRRLAQRDKTPKQPEP
jgi:hypothetical protein